MNKRNFLNQKIEELYKSDKEKVREIEEIIQDLFIKYGYKAIQDISSISTREELEKENGYRINYIQKLEKSNNVLDKIIKGLFILLVAEFILLLIK